MVRNTKNTITHITCRKCSRKAYHVKKKACFCGFPKTSRVRLKSH